VPPLRGMDRGVPECVLRLLDSRGYRSRRTHKLRLGRRLGRVLLRIRAVSATDETRVGPSPGREQLRTPARPGPFREQRPRPARDGSGSRSESPARPRGCRSSGVGRSRSSLLAPRGDPRSARVRPLLWLPPRGRGVSGARLDVHRSRSGDSGRADLPADCLPCG
jgi:hypothetical protein